MSNASKLALLKEMLDSAESSLRSARQVIVELMGGSGGLTKTQYVKMAATLPQSENAQIVEGIFDGQHMIAPDEKSYPVPANYASKSKLVPGDALKLTIGEDGAFVYKQIGPVERKRLIGTLVYEDGQYRVLANGKAFKVLLASITYYHAEIGDTVTLLVPEFQETEWGAIENIIPKSELKEE